MKINKKSILIFSILALLVTYMQCTSNRPTDYTLPNKSVLYLDETIFELYDKKFDTTKDLNRYWGFAKEKTLLEEKDFNSTKAKITQVTKDKDKNVLCIKSSCYRLLGIHNNKEKTFVTLYNKDLKEKVKDYTRGETLELDILIADISSNSVIIKDLNSSRTWKFKIFDVNQTKYIPKEIEK